MRSDKRSCCTMARLLNFVMAEVTTHDDDREHGVNSSVRVLVGLKAIGNENKRL